jgi:hypothetical protein
MEDREIVQSVSAGDHDRLTICWDGEVIVCVNNVLYIFVINKIFNVYPIEYTSQPDIFPILYLHHPYQSARPLRELLFPRTQLLNSSQGLLLLLIPVEYFIEDGTLLAFCDAHICFTFREYLSF